MESEKGGNDYDYNIMQQKRWKDSNILYDKDKKNKYKSSRIGGTPETLDQGCL